MTPHGLILFCLLTIIRAQDIFFLYPTSSPKAESINNLIHRGFTVPSTPQEALDKTANGKRKKRKPQSQDQVLEQSQNGPLLQSKNGPEGEPEAKPESESASLKESKDQSQAEPEPKKDEFAPVIPVLVPLIPLVFVAIAVFIICWRCRAPSAGSGPPLAQPLLADREAQVSEVKTDKQSSSESIAQEQIPSDTTTNDEDAVKPSTPSDTLVETNNTSVIERAAEFDRAAAQSGGIDTSRPGALALVWRGSAQTVHARGEWDGWLEDLVLTKSAVSGDWVAELPRSWEGMMYKFIVDGDWIVDEAQPMRECSGGHRNNAFTLVATGAP